MKYQIHNRQLPLANKYEDQIRREEIRGREVIIAGQCMAKAARAARPKARSERALHRLTPKPVNADIVIHIATCIPKNPGLGAWAATFVTKDGLTEESDYIPDMTQPLLELEAMIGVLTVIKELPGKVAIHTTARWIVQFVNDGTAEAWEANGWRKSSGDTVKNADSWAALWQLVIKRDAAVAWVRQDATPTMEKADRLARQVLKARKAI